VRFWRIEGGGNLTSKKCCEVKVVQEGRVPTKEILNYRGMWKGGESVRAAVDAAGFRVEFDIKGVLHHTGTRKR